jgi:hypothetical protein
MGRVGEAGQGRGRRRCRVVIGQVGAVGRGHVQAHPRAGRPRLTSGRGLRIGGGEAGGAGRGGTAKVLVV